MADTKISDLPAVTDVLGTDEYVLARAGATKKIDASDLAAAIGGGGDLSLAVAQTGHGLAVGDVVKLTGSNTYAKAQADSEANAEVVGIVSAVADADNFTLLTGGDVTGLSGLTAGAVYYLSPSSSGALTATEPTSFGEVSKPLLIARSTTAGLFFNMRGVIVSGPGEPASGARLTHSTSQSINNDTLTAVTFDTELYDTNGFHNGANPTRLTIPADGLYHVFGNVQFASDVDGRRVLGIMLNGTTAIAYDSRQAVQGGFATICEVNTDWEFVAGDYVELVVRHVAGAALNIEIADPNEYTPEFGIHALGGAIGPTGPPGASVGTEVAYTEFTSAVNPTATTEGTANTVVTASAFEADGVSAYMIEFFAYAARPDTGAAGRNMTFWLYEDGSSIGRMGFLTTPAAASCISVVSARRRLVPSSGSRTYSIRASVSAGTGSIDAGAGGAGNAPPGFIRITQATV